jgi:hypothetical protein
MEFRYPWDPPPPAPPPLPEPATVPSKPRGRRRRRPAAATAPNWLYHQLIISGPAAAVANFAAAARGAGVIPWRLDFARIEEDVFNLAAVVPAERRQLNIDGCHLLARQFRDRVEAHHAKAVALIGRREACSFDLHVLLPVPASVLRLGPNDPAALAWLTTHWGTSDRLRQVHALAAPRPGRRRGPHELVRGGPRLPAGHAVIGYGFFTCGETPHAAVATLQPRWPELRFVLRPRPA